MRKPRRVFALEKGKRFNYEITQQPAIEHEESLEELGC